MPFRGYERISFVHFVTQRRPGQPLAITVRRAGENLALSLDLVAAPKLVPRLDGVDARPQYLIVGGLVFVPLSVPFLMHHFGWPKYSPPPELLKWLREPQTEGSGQVVVLAKVLAADLNFGYQDMGGVQLKTLNGTAVSSMRELAEQLRSLSKEADFLEFELSDAQQVVLDPRACAAAEADILAAYGVNSPCSDELLEAP